MLSFHVGFVSSKFVSSRRIVLLAHLTIHCNIHQLHCRDYNDNTVYQLSADKIFGHRRLLHCRSGIDCQPIAHLALHIVSMVIVLSVGSRYIRAEECYLWLRACQEDEALISHILYSLVLQEASSIEQAARGPNSQFRRHN